MRAAANDINMERCLVCRREGGSTGLADGSTVMLVWFKPSEMMRVPGGVSVIGTMGRET